MDVNVLIKRMEALMDWLNRRYEACVQNVEVAIERDDIDRLDYWIGQADEAKEKSEDIRKALLIVKKMAGV